MFPKRASCVIMMESRSFMVTRAGLGLRSEQFSIYISPSPGLISALTNRHGAIRGVSSASIQTIIVLKD